jgi:hypothetical protein
LRRTTTKMRITTRINKRAIKKPKFKMGDVITVDCWDLESGIVVKNTRAHTIIESYSTQGDLEPLGIDEVETQKLRNELIDDWKLCKGINDPRLCVDCEHTDTCHQLQHIVRCNVSEFSGHRRNADVCERRDCKNRFICGTRRFINND